MTFTRWAASVAQLVEHHAWDAWGMGLISPECSLFFGKSCLRCCFFFPSVWIFMYIHPPHAARVVVKRTCTCIAINKRFSRYTLAWGMDKKWSKWWGKFDEGVWRFFLKRLFRPRTTPIGIILLSSSHLLILFLQLLKEVSRRVCFCESFLLIPPGNMSKKAHQLPKEDTHWLCTQG